MQTEVRPVVMDRAERWNLTARDGRTLEISVALPKGSPPAAGYPVLYALDADTAFATLVDVVRNHELAFGPAVVVGTGYPPESKGTDRRFDLTPRVDVGKLPNFYPEGWGPVGGADLFIDFIQHRLKPSVESLVCVDRNRQALFGHSLGGLFVLHTLLTRPESFDTFIAGSPAIWWGERQILGELPACKARLAKMKTRRRLLITVGGLEDRMSPEEINVARILKLVNVEQLVRAADMVGNAASLASQLQAFADAGLTVAFAEFPDETHNSVIPAYLARGARFALSHWFA